MLMRCIWGTLKLPRALFSANFSVSDTFKFAAGELVVAPYPDTPRGSVRLWVRVFTPVHRPCGFTETPRGPKLFASAYGKRMPRPALPNWDCSCMRISPEK